MYFKINIYLYILLLVFRILKYFDHFDFVTFDFQEFGVLDINLIQHHHQIIYPNQHPNTLMAVVDQANIY